MYASLTRAHACQEAAGGDAHNCESVTALRNLRAPRRRTRTRGGTYRMAPSKEGRRSRRHRETGRRGRPRATAAKCKRQRPNPRPDLQRGREAGGREGRRTQALGLATELNIRSKRRLEALSRRYPEKLELRAPQGATPIALRMQAQTAARFEDVLAHVTFTGAGTLGQPSGPLMGPDRTRGISHPRSGRAPAGAPPTNRPLLAFRADGGVCGLRMVRPSPTPCAVWF